MVIRFPSLPAWPRLPVACTLSNQITISGRWHAQHDRAQKGEKDYSVCSSYSCKAAVSSSCFVRWCREVTQWRFQRGDSIWYLMGILIGVSGGEGTCTANQTIHILPAKKNSLSPMDCVQSTFKMGDCFLFPSIPAKSQHSFFKHRLDEVVF